MSDSKMTERERREKGLPPHPASVALFVSMQKDAEAKMKHMAQMLQPIISNPMITASLKHTVEVVNTFNSMQAKRGEVISVPRNYDRTVRIAPDQFVELTKRETKNDAPNVLYMDLMYDRKTKELYRIVYGERLPSPFTDKEGNKRLLLLETLLKHGRSPVATRKLAEYLQCTQKQIQNIVQAINAKLEKDLQLPHPLITANKGSGYFINRFFCVHSVK